MPAKDSREPHHRILVVDDEPRMIRFIQMNLELEGYDVIQASNGFEALNQVRDALPDLVILDVMMPNLDGFETLRLLREVSAVPVIKQLSDLPVVADPSHGTGIRSLVAPMAKAGVAAGADGLIIEVHPHPEKALSDGDQSLPPKEFADLMREIAPIAGAVGKRMST